MQNLPKIVLWANETPDFLTNRLNHGHLPTRSKDISASYGKKGCGLDGRNRQSFDATSPVYWTVLFCFSHSGGQLAAGVLAKTLEAR